MHGTIESGFRVEIRRLDELAAFASELRDARPHARSRPTHSTSPPSWRRPRRCSAATCMAGLVWRRAMPRQLIGFFPVAIERRRYGLKMPMLGRLDASLRAARHAADRPRLRRRRGRGLARSHRRRPDAAEADADAVSAGRGRCRARLRRRARPSRRPQRALCAAPPRAAGAAQATAPAISTTRSPHKKRKELRRQRKRLADTGALTSTTTSDPAATDRGAARFPVARSRRLEGPRRHRGEGQRRRPLLRRRGGERARRRRQGVGRAARARRPRHRRHRDAALGRHRLVLEDRL